MLKKKYNQLSSTKQLLNMTNKELIAHKKYMEEGQKELLEYIQSLSDEYRYVKKLLKDRLQDIEYELLEAEEIRKDWDSPTYSIDNEVH